MRRLQDPAGDAYCTVAKATLYTSGYTQATLGDQLGNETVIGAGG